MVVLVEAVAGVTVDSGRNAQEKQPHGGSGGSCWPKTGQKCGQKCRQKCRQKVDKNLDKNLDKKVDKNLDKNLGKAFKNKITFWPILK